MELVDPDKNESRLQALNVIEMDRVILFLDGLLNELDNTLEMSTPNPVLRMSLELLRRHFSAKPTYPTLLIEASGVPYATAVRRLREMITAGLIEQRPRTKSGKSFSLHPSKKLLVQWQQLSCRTERMIEEQFGNVEISQATGDYYFAGSYLMDRAIPPLQAFTEPLKLAGGIRVLVHGDPTFMVMSQLKRYLEQIIGCDIRQRAFSIDRLYEEAVLNSKRELSLYDITAVDLPWVGEFAERGVLIPLDEIMDVERLDPADFHPEGWQAAHWGGRCYGVPTQTTPELLFYRRDLFAEAEVLPPTTTNELLDAAKALHDPQQQRFGIAWNAARGTALGHTVLMTMADFGQPVIDLHKIAGGYDTRGLKCGTYRATINTKSGLRAMEFLLELIKYSPPDILSMSWYERVRRYATGNVAMAYGYTLLAPYFELDESTAAHGQTGYLPHPSGLGASPIAPVGGYLLGIPANISPDRIPATIDALVLFTSPQAQKLYIQNGSRTNPRYSVGADLEVQRISPIFKAIDDISQRDELQYWPRPPIPELNSIIQICGTEMHDMLRGIVSPREALQRSQEQSERAIQQFKTLSNPPKSSRRTNYGYHSLER